MNINDVRILCKEFAKEYWDMEFNVPVKVNGRLTRSLGRMCFQINRLTGEITPTKLEVAKRLLENYSNETIISVIKHELTHWALAVQGKPFNDGHPVFERELQRVGASSTNTIQIAGKVHTVVCSECGKEQARHNNPGAIKKYVYGTRRMSYSSGCCRAKMEWGPTLQIEDRNGEVDNSLDRRAQREQRRQLALAARQEAAATLQNEEPEKETQRTATAKRVSSKDLKDILIPGPRGVTNKQMIPAIMKAIDLSSKDLIDELKNQYPKVFESSFKYLNKKYKSRYEALIS